LHLLSYMYHKLCIPGDIPAAGDACADIKISQH
jgi:hypothetical protein